MKVGLCFGSFNPIHYGHLIIANYMLQNSDLDQIWLVVSPQNPFKQSASLLNSYNRLNLVQLATEGEPKLKASDIEFQFASTILHCKYAGLFTGKISHAISLL